ncbi:putative D-alanyl-D-alanine carboxypeptidase [Hyphomonas neptunium ATCC 15444]|uniref:Putative D-alanyl-D-alanine carboxypeptidase n=2 Tax=Hyphomonas TaxID=85 RepID=Q0C3E6_HYPNA|nr:MULTISPECIES: D-alanyl-D-alanine carboxypeptidase family protein [Hyphomonas]ABI77441.1 putative D-alanyl-D-alanine carboxypeptidase [Hyphomonas neptunium ATCC 15444]KCZ96044.1 putative D-alanyl-D-alanine carboxypeptidase [Hyphomonas hirschiana VP5]
MAAKVWSRAFRGSAIAASVSITAAVMAPSAHAEKYAAIVVDADSGEVLHARNQDDPRYPASLTKVMTLYLLFDAIDAGDVSLKDKIKVSRNAAAQPPSNLRLRAGDTITVEDAIYALTTKSANDVAAAVAEFLGGSERKFAAMMTDKARDLGLSNTTFRNASGLPDTAQLSTARDLAILADALLDNHEPYYHYFQNQRFSWGGMTYKSHNNLIGSVDGVDGIKTGYTRASGFNLMTSAERDGRRVIAIVLGGASAKSRDAHVTELVESAFVSIGQTPDLIDPNTKLMSFAALDTPLNPNAAAEPMLNGRPLSAILAEQAGTQPAEVLQEAEIAEGDAAEQAPTLEVVPEIANTPKTVAPEPKAPESKVAEYKAPDYKVPDSLTVSGYQQAQTGAAAKAPQALPAAAAAADTISVSEYEASQAAKAAAAKAVMDYTRRQLRRR